VPRWWLFTVAAVLFSSPVAKPATAAEVYRWVDNEGVVHYSDQRPEHDAPVTVLEIESSPPSSAYDAVNDPYSILNQAARIHEGWRDLEAVRQARAQERSDALPHRELPSPPEYDGYFERSSYPYYWALPASSPDYRPGQGRQQIYALHTLDLLGQRPASVNSGPHLDRVERSQFLPIVPPPPLPQPR